MPTKDEFKELLNSSYCTWILAEQTTSSGSSNKGYKVTSVKNGNSIFLPASGYCDGENFNIQGLYYGYWSSSLFPVRSRSASGLWLSSGSPVSDGVDRCYGLTVRPVAEK